MAKYFLALIVSVALVSTVDAAGMIRITFPQINFSTFSREMSFGDIADLSLFGAAAGTRVQITSLRRNHCS
jgi:hypothetical protein